jgi:hypothetical protein
VNRSDGADEKVEEPQAELELLEQVEDLRPEGDVERRDRLVEHDEFRRERNGTGDAEALALAAREFMRIRA